MSADVARSHGGDGGGEDCPLHTMYPAVAWVALLTEEITDKKGPVPIQFELREKQTVMPLGDHAAHWFSYIGEVIRGVPLYYPSWLKVPKERNAALITDIRTQFDLRPNMESPDWTEINVGIQQHLQKAYNTNKAAFKAQHWVIDPTTGTYNVEKIRRERPENITASEWDKYIEFWNDPRNIARAAQNWQNRKKEHGHISTGIPEEMRRLEAMGTYTDDEINRLARGGKWRGHIAGVGKVLPARATASPSTPAHESTLNSLHKKVDFMMSLFKSDSKDCRWGRNPVRAFPSDNFPATSAGESHPQRQVAGGSPVLLLRKALNVVVNLAAKWV
nr:F-box domain, leucine-rich repeat domain, L domain-like protein [Tanacetum cinerariifolium]